MKKVLAKSAAAVLALLLAAGMCFFAACDSGTPPSEGYTAFYNAVQRKGGIDYEDLDDDNSGALDITLRGRAASRLRFPIRRRTRSTWRLLIFTEIFQKCRRAAIMKIIIRRG